MTAKPITDKVKRLRQRQRADGSWRVWWEPEGAVRALGFEAVELNAEKPTWSLRQAKQFNADVSAVRDGGSRARPRGGGGDKSIAGLIAAYRLSPRYRDKATHTRRSYDGNLKVIEAKWGDAPVADFTKPVMFEWYETLCQNHGTTYASGLVGMMSILFNYAELKGLRPERSNPCFRLGRTAARKRKRFASWAEFDQLLASADTLGHHAMACAIAACTLSSQRQTDIIKMQISGIREVTAPDVLGQPRPLLAWELVRSKRQNLGAFPLHPEVEARVRPLMEGRSDGHLLIDEATGKPYTVDLFGKRFTSIRRHAAKEVPSLTAPGRQLQFRDLRRTFGVWARAGGASKDDIGDVLGNSAAIDPQLGEIYMPAQFDTALRAVFAIKRPAKD